MSEVGGGGAGAWPSRVVVVGGNGSPDEQVVNVGTKENPNFGGSAYAMGRLQGLRDALAALKALDPEDEYAYDECLEAVVALLPKGVDW